MLGARPDLDLAIEDLIKQLKEDYTIVIVTHNMQQAARVEDTALLHDRRHRQARPPDQEGRHPTIFTVPDKAHRGLHHRPLRLSFCFSDHPDEKESILVDQGTFPHSILSAVPVLVDACG